MNRFPTGELEKITSGTYIKQQIRTHGCVLLSVAATPMFPRYGCSLGFHALDHPDVLITGLSAQACQAIMLLMYQGIQAGTRFDQPGVDYPDFTADSLAQTVPVHPAWADRLTGAFRDVYPTHGYIQFIWRDEQNRLPWEDGFLLPQLHPMLTGAPA
jgi:hypothetical protein